ncbi:phage tail protein [uncultured Psychrosphaera sp.]|uniref:phage tail protein n=1 Tax=uncultured Psychrosphaera sp. TaxID=1403522 RepID=UPI00262A098B|nr:phage tail protein [uncultured Psychrosphaera sp.]
MLDLGLVNQNVLSIIEGHDRFLKRNTGLTNDAQVEFFAINPDGVLNNNRHFLQKTQMEGKPNADATTEGQSVLILSYIYCYMATKDPQHLESAKKYWDAYVAYWYNGQPIPETTQRWVCNWIINGKEPVLANYPLNETAPTHGGFKGIEFDFIDGLTLIPHGAPHWGEYMDIGKFAFIGVLSFDSIKASVKQENPDGSTNWDEDGIQYDVDWIITWEGKKVNWDGNVLSEGHTLEEVGTVQLKDIVTGTLKFNYATRNPVEHGGYLIGRNECMHNRPLHVPVSANNGFLGNAADGEVWFLDACYLMHKVTGEQKYYDALQCVLYTAHEYTLIDSTDRFFRKDAAARTPFTDGISYDYTYPSTEPEFSRDEDGYILATLAGGEDVTLEQKAIKFRITKDSLCQVVWGGVTSTGTSLKADIEMDITRPGSTVEDSYVVNVPESTSALPVDYRIPLSKFSRRKTDEGEDYIVAKGSGVTDYGTCTYQDSFETDIQGVNITARDSNVVTASFPDDDGGFIIGFWLLENSLAPIKSITYKSDTEFDLRVEDDNLWRWYWLLPNTRGVWTTIDLYPEDMILNGYQPNHEDDEVEPLAPLFTTLESLTVVLENSSDLNKTFTLYCVNEIPPLFTEADGYTSKFSITISSPDELGYTAVIGDCTMLDYRNDSLAYTPGLIPFSNIYESDSEQFGAWHGLPYPGYQSPTMYCLGFSDNDDVKLNNVVDFLYDSQQYHYDLFGVLGPGASAYIWDRWDNLEYGPADTFTMYHWGDGHAWSGYQPRAFSWACRAWQELVERGREPPEKLVIYCENWIKWLIQFAIDGNGITPSEFPSDSPSIPVEDDFNAAMCGLWLSGCSLAGLAGCQLDGLEEFMGACIAEMEDNYEVISHKVDHPMNGTWSSWASPNDNEGQYYGFHGAEAMKGLALYLLYKQSK